MSKIDDFLKSRVVNKDTTKEKLLSLRLEKNEHAFLESLGKQLKMSKAAIIRELIFGLASGKFKI